MCRPPTPGQGTGILRPGDRRIFTASFSIFLTDCFNYNSTIQTSEIMSHLLACIRSTRSNAVYATSAHKSNPSTVNGRISGTHNSHALSPMVLDGSVTRGVTSSPGCSGEPMVSLRSEIAPLKRELQTRKSQKGNAN